MSDDFKMPAFEDDPVAMALGFTPHKPGVLLPGTPEHCHRCALDALDVLRSENTQLQAEIERLRATLLAAEQDYGAEKRRIAAYDKLIDQLHTAKNTLYTIEAMDRDLLAGYVPPAGCSAALCDLNEGHDGPHVSDGMQWSYTGSAGFVHKMDDPYRLAADGKAGET